MSAKPQGEPPPLLTPIVVKQGSQTPWPEGERLFYLIARDGLYICRQHEFFRSCVKAKAGPSELGPQAPMFEPRFPTIPGEIIERAVGFFTRVADLHGSEAAALLVWDPSESRVRLVVPHQTATMGGMKTRYPYPIGVHYDPPTNLPADWVIFGDIHCHVTYSAYASHTDKEDELHSAGLHIVVGHIHEDPPDFHVEAVVDGDRFPLALEDISEGYVERRMEVPQDWLDQIEIEQYTWDYGSTGYYSN